jgi:hypothetical protein
MDATAKTALPASADLQARRHHATSGGTRPDWFPDWDGATCAIVASGPSAATAGVDQLRDSDVRVIAINTSYQLVPWAGVLYGCDARWWRCHRGARDFHGLKISQDRAACSEYRDVHRVRVNPHSNDLVLAPLGVLGAGGNGGFQALNLAVQFGVKRLLLIGYDMRIDLGEHWHKRHPAPLSNPHPVSNLPRWRKAIDGAAAELKALGIEVINCSEVSALRAYRKMSLERALYRE